MIKLSNVNKIFSDYILFKDISCEIRKGEFVGLVGNSGIGKSTLLYMISGLKEITDGEVVINGIRMNVMNTKELLQFRQQHFGFIFQENYLINYLNVKENILLPITKPTPVIQSRLDELTNFFGISHLMNKFPGELSVGQKQRVSIARALINNPDILFADEPTAALDEENAEKVITLLKELNLKQNLTIIMVSHNQSHWHYFDRIFELKNKTMAELQKEAVI